MKLVTTLILLIIATLSHAAMYKWTDEQGNTHYGEQPPNRQQAQNIAPPPPPASSSTDSSDRINALRAGIFKQSENSKKTKQAAREQAQDDKEHKEYCGGLRKRLATFKDRPRIRQKDKEGNYKYLGEEQKQKQQQEMQQRLTKDCS